jgi:hypothetical protein
MLGVTATDNISMSPAVLYLINLQTGQATKITNLVGSSYVMGVAYGRDGYLYAMGFHEQPRSLQS